MKFLVNFLVLTLNLLSLLQIFANEIIPEDAIPQNDIEDFGRILNSVPVEIQEPTAELVDNVLPELIVKNTTGSRDGKIPAVHSTPEENPGVPTPILKVNDESSEATIFVDSVPASIEQMKNIPEDKTIPVVSDDTGEKLVSSIDNNATKTEESENEEPVSENISVPILPIDSPKLKLPHEYLSYFLHYPESEQEQGNANDQIIVKPPVAPKKSILSEILGRTCIYCQNYRGIISGRHAMPNPMLKFSDFVPEESRDLPIDLHSTELRRRRLNFQRVSTLLPDHRSLPILEQFLYKSSEKPIEISSGNNNPANSARSFWAKLFPFWPFLRSPATSNEQPQNSGRIELPLTPHNPEDEIIMRPSSKPISSLIPKSPSEPLLSIDNGFSTINEIHEGLNKQNAVKLQPVNILGAESNSGKTDAKKQRTDLFGIYSRYAPDFSSNSLPEPRQNRFRSLISPSQDPDFLPPWTPASLPPCAHTHYDSD